MKLPNFDEFAPFVAVHKQMDARPAATLSLVAIERLRSVAVDAQTSDWQLPTVEKREIIREVAQPIIDELPVIEEAVQDIFITPEIEEQEPIAEIIEEESVAELVEPKAVLIEEELLPLPPETEEIVESPIVVAKKHVPKKAKPKRKLLRLFKAKHAVKLEKKQAEVQHEARPQPKTSSAISVRMIVVAALLITLSGGIFYGLSYVIAQGGVDKKPVEPMMATPSPVQKMLEPTPPPQTAQPASVVASQPAQTQPVPNPQPVAPEPASPAQQQPVPVAAPVASQSISPPSPASDASSPTMPSDAASTPTNELPPPAREENAATSPNTGIDDTHSEVPELSSATSDSEATQVEGDSSVGSGLGGTSEGYMPELEKTPQEILDELMIEKPFDDIRRKAGQEILPEEMLLLPSRP